MSIKEEFPQLKAALLLRIPFLASLLMRARIIITRSVPTAAVTDNYTILVNDKFLESLSFEDKVFTFCHEVLHIALNHVARKGQDMDMEVWNYATDAVINKLLDEMIKATTKFKKELITMESIHAKLNDAGIRIPYEELIKMSAEEIYQLLIKLPKSNFKLFIGDLISDAKEDERGEVLQEGDNEIYGTNDKDEQSSEERRKKMADAWKEAFVKSYVLQKSVGNVPAFLQLLIDNMLESKVDWKILLKEAFRYGLGRTILSTYKRVSRKHEALPGHRRYTVPDVYVLIDTSGSIDKEELEQFMGEVYEIAKMCTIQIVPWDATMYEPIAVKNPSDVVTKVMRMMRGGGGTVIADALEYVNTNMKTKDIVTVLTDGDIADIDDAKTQRLLDEVATKAGVAVFVSTHQVVEIPKWRFIKLARN